MPTIQELGQGYAQKYGIDFGLFSRVIQQESGWHHWDTRGNVLTSAAGAKGIAQLLPDTAKGLGVNWADQLENLRGGAMYLAQQIKRYGGDIVRGTAAYNAGPGNIDKWTGTRQSLRDLRLGETEKYLDAIFGTGWKVGTTGPVPSDGTTIPTPNVPAWAQPIIDAVTNAIPSPAAIGSGLVSGITDAIKHSVENPSEYMIDFLGIIVGVGSVSGGIALAAIKSDTGKEIISTAAKAAARAPVSMNSAGPATSVATRSAIRTVPSRSVTVRNRPQMARVSMK